MSQKAERAKRAHTERLKRAISSKKDFVFEKCDSNLIINDASKKVEL